jgi:hypothetical protein
MKNNARTMRGREKKGETVIFHVRIFFVNYSVGSVRKAQLSSVRIRMMALSRNKSG